MKKIFIFCSLLSVSLIQTVLPMSAYDIAEKSRSLEEKLEQAEQAELKSHCCYALGCCSETVASSCAQGVATGQAPDLLRLYRIISGTHTGFNSTSAATDHYSAPGVLVASAIAFCGIGMPQSICYPSSDIYRKEAVNLRNSANTLRAELAQNQVPTSVTMAPSPLTRALPLNQAALRQLTFNQNIVARQRD
jgi:hypothetical protein